MLNFNKLQDAFVKLVERLLGVTLPRIRQESIQTLDAVERLADSAKDDMTAIRAAAVSALEQIGRTSGAVAIDIEVAPPGGGRWAITGTVKSIPPDEGED